jgi:hypothetical protein
MEEVTKGRLVEVAENLLKVHLDADGKVLDKKICIGGPLEPPHRKSVLHPGR